MATGGDIVDRVLQRLEESTSSPVFYSRAEALVHLNDGYLELVLISGNLTSERNLTLTSSNFMVVPDGAIAITNIGISNRAIQKGTVEGADRDNVRWIDKTGTPRAWAPIGLNRFFVERRVTATGTVAKLATLDMPAEIGEGTTIDLEDEYLDALENYTFHAIRFKEGGAEFAQSIQEYDEFLALAGHVAKRDLSEDYSLWARDLASDTGMGYSTLERS